jgi:hypothetical protein
MYIIIKNNNIIIINTTYYYKTHAATTQQQPQNTYVGRHMHHRIVMHTVMLENISIWFEQEIVDFNRYCIYLL